MFDDMIEPTDRLLLLLPQLFWFNMVNDIRDHTETRSALIRLFCSIRYLRKIIGRG